MSRPERYPLPNPILKGNVLTIFTTQYTFIDYYKDGGLLAQIIVTPQSRRRRQQELNDHI